MRAKSNAASRDAAPGKWQRVADSGHFWPIDQEALVFDQTDAPIPHEHPQDAEPRGTDQRQLEVHTMSTRKTTWFYGALIAMASLAIGMVIASRLDMTPSSAAQ